MTTDRHLTEFPAEGDLIHFPCPITEAGLGGPVIDLAEHVLGLSIDIVNETTLILPLMALRERLEYLDKFIPNSTNFHEYTLPEDVHSIVPSGFMKHVKYLMAGGYPKPPPLMLEVCGRLCDTFEEFFGQLLAYKGCCCNINHHTSGEEVWAKLPKGVVTKISRRVVTLSSYDGDVRAFACTGLLMKWHKNGTPVILTSASLVRSRVDEDKIDENFKIRVFLPPKQAGIGGPLVNFVNGSFAGMNFYDRTNRIPYLPRRFIVRALSRIDLPSQRGLNHPIDIMGDATVKKNRWPVPKPYWYQSMFDDEPPLRFVGRVLH
nr:uncharacterized protein LOC120966599 isoform X1 [Aegilops tauschii subsp. strangulata]XP_045086010.1 uncharacterized protein LOC120966599 isoform X1 [Aegilops tauschii subsp. strangulata]